VTLASYRCLPDGGRSRPRPPTPTGGFLAAVDLAARGPQAAVDVYGRPAGRPPWLAAGSQYLALLERQGRGVGVIYLLHFDRPIGDLTNPRGFASHYTGKPASSGLLKVGWRVGGGGFAELTVLAWLVGLVERVELEAVADRGRLGDAEELGQLEGVAAAGLDLGQQPIHPQLLGGDAQLLERLLDMAARDRGEPAGGALVDQQVGVGVQRFSGGSSGGNDAVGVACCVHPLLLLG
jgi:hypothetical protein